MFFCSRCNKTVPRRFAQSRLFFVGSDTRTHRRVTGSPGTTRVTLNFYISDENVLWQWVPLPRMLWFRAWVVTKMLKVCTQNTAVVLQTCRLLQCIFVLIWEDAGVFCVRLHRARTPSLLSSVNFVLNSIFVFVFVSLTELYFRFRLFSVFACIFVFVFVSFVYYRFRFLL